MAAASGPCEAASPSTGTGLARRARARGRTLVAVNSASRALALLLVTAAAAAASEAEPPSVDMVLEGGDALFEGVRFAAGQTVVLGVQVSNPLGNPPADLHLGALLPDGSLVFATPSGAVGMSPHARPSGYPPLQAVPPGTRLDAPALLQYTLPEGSAPGSYLVFAALIRQGALADDRVDPGDVVALATQEMTIDWSPWPPELQAIGAVLPLPPGLHLHVSDTGCISGAALPCESVSGLSMFDENAAEIVLRSDWDTFGAGATYEDVLGVLAHEMCHAHQYNTVLESGLSLGDAGVPEQWLQTEEGLAFLAAGGHTTPPGGVPEGVYHAFATVCEAWYLRPEALGQEDPAMFAFAQEWLPAP